MDNTSMFMSCDLSICEKPTLFVFHYRPAILSL